MKIFGSVLNLVIIEGIYSALPVNVGIPLERRQLKSFGKNKIKITKITSSSSSSSPSSSSSSADSEKLLSLIVTKLYEIIDGGGDVKNLLMTGSGYTDLLVGSISLMCNPNSNKAFYEKYQTQFTQIEKLSNTFQLFSIYTLLLQPYSQPWLKKFVSSRLSLLTVERADGVKSLIEFVAGLREDEDINIEKIDHICNVIMSKPRQFNSADYFGNVGKQLYDILVLINRPILTSVACNIVETLFEKKSLIVKDFIFSKIWECFNPKISENKILTSEVDLNNAVNVIISLTKKSSPELLKCLFQQLILPLWSYTIYVKSTKRNIEVPKSIFISFFTITNDLEFLDTIAKNLLLISGENWIFENGENGLIVIKKKTTIEDNNITNNNLFDSLDIAVDLFMNILKDLNEELLQKEFGLILKRWLNVSDSKIDLQQDGEDDPFIMLIDLRLLENIVDKYKEKLSRSPDDMLEVVKNVLINNTQNLVVKKENKQKDMKIMEKTIEQGADSDDEDSDDEEDELRESLSVVLELLSAILSETTTTELNESSVSVLKEISTLLLSLSNQNKSAESLYNRIQSILAKETLRPKSSREKDEETLKRAITSLNDPLVPIRAHGLFLLRQLIDKRSDVVSLEFVIELNLLQLKDPDPFIYLNVIKGLDSLLKFDKNNVLPILIDFYINPKQELDERLRIGEVLLRFIQNANDTFTGNVADLVSSATLSLIRIPSTINESEHETSLKADNRLRMSAMSLLGVCCKVNPIGLISKLPDCFDCVLGILNLETSSEESIMRRSAVVLVNDLVTGPGGIEGFPPNYGKKIVNLLKYLVETDNDLLVREQARDVLSNISTLQRERFSNNDSDTGLQKGYNDGIYSKIKIFKLRPMKLKISTASTESLRNTLGAIISLRKFCILRFTPQNLHIISASLNEPQVWCKLSQEIFDIYEVESIRDNTISMEINIEPLYQVLKNFERTNSYGLSIRLQRKNPSANNADGTGGSKQVISASKSLATLSIFYNEHVSVSSSISHTFRIPVRLLKKESDERIREPELSNVDVFMKLNRDIVSLFKRVERYKKAEYLNIAATKNGYLGLTINEDTRKITASWRERLPVQQINNSNEDQEDETNIRGRERDRDEPINVMVKLRDWKLGANICELSSNVVLIISEMEALVLHCYLDENENCEIVYYVSGINQQ
ncbi:hypothetical protein PACTADRAFT_3673 [Pachysolen tannophilus NRRL Y-2460]|uniref:TATA-binding protein interacting (TIP20) domain-containing protein n=1 Tax=Pachysolen tannophilus NRRL Y-2460 TaxID=669874 RepID=A0A1E4TSN7_PACTA|nr:hypothetical protein PACTADRAFT_3673 [Pachysolen tannophilus NRRL Y-2460]